MRATSYRDPEQQDRLSARARQRQFARLVRQGEGGPYQPIIRQALVRGWDDETLEVEFVDGNPQDGRVLSGVTLYVARPFIQLRSSYDDQTIDGVTYAYVDKNTRTATQGATEETQVITPSYVVDHSVVMVAKVASYAGLVKSTSPVEYVYWVDLNVDGRSWAKDPTA